MLMQVINLIIFLFYIDIRVNFVLKMLAWSVKQTF